ncbi:hypothetical protein Pint_18603 [Pistacia integerrima]|uniref:Uncharacterized protein n=1 Tax=Pistacia integerrima TaxID=434235 RepID=A0ACC0YXB4_9ROSI|nr:hypothetical protein Pint_18603 [Pistacia integerrima]
MPVQIAADIQHLIILNFFVDRVSKNYKCGRILLNQFDLLFLHIPKLKFDSEYCIIEVFYIA